MIKRYCDLTGREIESDDDIRIISFYRCQSDEGIGSTSLNGKLYPKCNKSLEIHAITLNEILKAINKLRK